jgi:pimeloyl-ACP methyl ester carboxylesterase
MQVAAGPGCRTRVVTGAKASLTGETRCAMTAEASAATTDPNTAIRPFEVSISDGELEDLFRRVELTRWPSDELVADGSQGVQAAVVKALAFHWLGQYDWRECEARLNDLPQFVTNLDGLDVHFIHVRSDRDDALPLLITHGWPGSVLEMLDAIGPLTDPGAHGGEAGDAFHVVIPSLPGYGFSARPTELGWDVGRTGRAWDELMGRLGYERYVAQGGDVGAAVTDTMALQAPPGLAGIHLNFLRRPPPEIAAAVFGGAPEPPGLDPEEAAAFVPLRAQFRKGYIAEQSGTPQTIGYSVEDSPVGLAAWILDHDTDSYEKIARAFLGGEASGGLTPDRVLDNISLYWLTGTATSAARIYWENARAGARAAADGAPPPETPLSVAFTVFPGEIFRAPRIWVERVYPNLVYFNEVDRGGHFAAWEEPAVFAEEMRAAFRTLR